MRMWIKLYTEILNDPKMGRLSDRQFRTCINIFALAGLIDDCGRLGSLDDVAFHLRMNADICAADLTAMAGVDICGERDDEWYLCHFEARQAKSPSASREEVLDRVTKFRKRHAEIETKRNESVTSLHPERNESVTLKEKNRGEKNRVEESVTSLHLESTQGVTTLQDEQAANAASPQKTDKTLTPQQAMVSALADVMGMKPSLNAKRLVRLAAELLKDGISPDEVRRIYGRGSWWYSNDWRGKKGDFPNQAAIRETIARAQADGKPDELVLPADLDAEARAVHEEYIQMNKHLHPEGWDPR